MSHSEYQTVVPPSAVTSIDDVGGQRYLPNPDGSFLVPAHVAARMRATPGWTVREDATAVVPHEIHHDGR